MSICERCDLYDKKLCFGIKGGTYCTDLQDEQYTHRHPAAIDPQGAALSCETSFFYEKPALERARGDTSEKHYDISE